MNAIVKELKFAFTTRSSIGIDQIINGRLEKLVKNLDD
jgi:hypothetical protein